MAFDKPYEWTSFGLVAKVRYLLCKRLGVKKLKVGHAGTLDPLATGVLLVCTGKATKRIEELQAHTKEYVATLRLGATTPSFDLEKPVDAEYPTEHITREMVEETLNRFVGTIEQVPPVFSACKVNGSRAYDLARKGEEVELKDVGHRRTGTVAMRTAGICHPGGVQQRYLHPGVGPRHRGGLEERRPPDGLTPYANRSGQSGRLPETG